MAYGSYDPFSLPNKPSDLDDPMWNLQRQQDMQKWQLAQNALRDYQSMMVNYAGQQIQNQNASAQNQIARLQGLGNIGALQMSLAGDRYGQAQALENLRLQAMRGNVDLEETRNRQARDLGELDLRALQETLSQRQNLADRAYRRSVSSVPSVYQTAARRYGF